MSILLNSKKENPSIVLLIVEKEKHLEKREQYINLLEIDDVLTVDNIDEAEQVLSKEENKKIILLLDDIIIENVPNPIDKIKRIKDVFKGNIILKVHDEVVGLELLKAGLINEYFLANTDSKIEEQNFLKSLKITKLKARINSTLRVNEENLTKLVEKVNDLELEKKKWK